MANAGGTQFKPVGLTHTIFSCDIYRGIPTPEVLITLILSKQFLQGEEQMHNPPQQCGYTGKVPYTALCSWEQSVVGNAGLCFTGTNMDNSFVLWEQKPKYCVRHVTHQTLLFLLAWMVLLRAEPLGLLFPFCYWYPLSEDAACWVWS